MRFATEYPDDERVNVSGWLERNGIEGSGPRGACWDLGVRVGVPPGPGLLCVQSIRSPPQSVARIYRAREHRLEQVWQATVATSSNWLELTPFLSPDGTVLELRDRAPHCCEHALKEYRAKERDGVEPGFGAPLARGCAAVGTYEWKGAGYVKCECDRRDTENADADVFDLDD